MKLFHFHGKTAAEQREDNGHGCDSIDAGAGYFREGMKIKSVDGEPGKVEGVLGTFSSIPI